MQKRKIFKFPCLATVPLWWIIKTFSENNFYEKNRLAINIREQDRFTINRPDCFHVITEGASIFCYRGGKRKFVKTVYNVILTNPNTTLLIIVHVFHQKSFGNVQK